MVFGNTVDDIERQDRTFIEGQFDGNGDLLLNRFVNGVKQNESATALFSNLANSDLSGLRSIHNTLLDFAGTDLSTNSGLLNLSQGLFDARVAQQEFELSQPSRASILRSERFRIGNAAAAAEFDAINANTNFIDFDSDAGRFNIASGVSQRVVQELMSLALNIVALPLLLEGAAIKGTKVLIGGTFGGAVGAGSLLTSKITNRGIIEGLDILQRTGLNTIGSVASDVTVRGLNSASQVGFERQQQTIQFQLDNNLLIMPERVKF